MVRNDGQSSFVQGKHLFSKVKITDIDFLEMRSLCANEDIQGLKVHILPTHRHRVVLTDVITLMHSIHILQS